VNRERCRSWILTAHPHSYHPPPSLPTSLSSSSLSYPLSPHPPSINLSLWILLLHPPTSSPQLLCSPSAFIHLQPPLLFHLRFIFFSFPLVAPPYFIPFTPACYSCFHLIPFLIFPHLSSCPTFLSDHTTPSPLFTTPQTRRILLRVLPAFFFTVNPVPVKPSRPRQLRKVHDYSESFPCP
jgi:hypothetical protein